MSISIFTDVPVEIKEFYAQYFDLKDLYSLIKTCKSWRQIIDEDLGFQKICLSNTTNSLRYRNRSVRSLFQSRRALKSIKSNDPTLFAFYVPHGSCAEIAKMLIATDGPFGDPIFRYLIASAIKKEDADKVLAYLLECCPSVPAPDIYSKKCPDQSIDFNTVVSILCNVFLKENEIESDRNKKTVRLFLEYLKQSKDALLGSWIEHKETIWSYSDVTLIESCSRVLEYLKHFPEIGFEVEVPYASSEPDLYKMTPLVHAAIYRNEAMFNLLLKQGAKFDPREPYLTLYYEYNGLGYDDFRKKLVQMGAVPLPKTSNHERQSILRFSVSMQNPQIVEHFLCEGAKLLPDEEADWLSKPRNTAEHSIAIRQKQSKYNPSEYVTTLPFFEESIAFSGGRFKFLKIMANGSFEFHAGMSWRYRFRYKHTGSYELNEDNTLQLHIRNTTSNQDEDDYYGTSDEPHHTPCTKFIILSTALHRLALIPADHDANAPAEHKIDMMLTSFTNAS